MAVRFFRIGNTEVIDFVGYRVNRSVGGDFRQRYFSIRRDGIIVIQSEQQKIHDQALACDEIWRLEANAIRQAKSIAAIPTLRAKSGSPVAGICAQRIGQRIIMVDGRPGRRYYSVWTVAVADNPHRRFYLTKDGDPVAFGKAVDCLCCFKRWSPKRAHELKARWIPHRYGSDPLDVPED